MRKVILILVLLAFLILTGLALWQHGLIGIFEPVFQSFGAAQIFWDLVIALSLFLVWMWKDARRAGRNPWPWLLGTLATGSIAALLYLIVYDEEKQV
ncbi:MAG: DUF2834 domain-containing protein [Spirochaetaceae bacterium]|nr:DUF2834 domain-containing protein [Spirochaetaceae bacterium]|tara:strand:- start:113867 stop:114157 length:291 start_codon:yes stop_codon:yes gene_type:complete